MIATNRKRLIWAIVGLCILAGGITAEYILTRPVRDALQTFNALILSANQGDLVAARSLCSRRYLATHKLELAGEGGLVGLPRTIHMNFQAWKQGPDVWICPTKGVGPIYRLIRQDDVWQFDGLIGQRGRDGTIQTITEEK